MRERVAQSRRLGSGSEFFGSQGELDPNQNKAGGDLDLLSSQAYAWQLTAQPDNLNQAYDLYTRILERDPDRAEDWYLRAQVVQKNAGCIGKLSFAVQDLREALARDPANRRYLHSLQDILRRLGRTEDRRPVLKQLVQIEGADSAYAAIAEAVEKDRNEKLALRRWATRNELPADSPLDLVERARTSWKAWWKEESRHPHFTRFLGLLDPRTIRLRYDKTARRRGYILCEESVDLPSADRVMRYWRKPLD